MLNFQLPIAGILATTAGVSLVLLYFSRPNVGNSTIQLPTHLGRDDSLFRDPFDVAQPEDMIDGYPINEGIFWDNVCIESPSPFSSLSVSRRSHPS